MYTINPRLPKIRRDAVKMLRLGHSTRAVAHHFGLSQKAISNWSRRAISDSPIPTRSSRPRISPKRISNRVREQNLRTTIKVLM